MAVYSLAISPTVCFPSLREGARKEASPFTRKFKGLSLHPQTGPCQLRLRLCNLVIAQATDMAAGHSDEPQKLLDQSMDSLRSFWQSLPEPIKSFPWSKAFGHFVEIVFQLVSAVAKWLSIPILVVSSLSEMSYCAHEHKMKLIPFPLLIGFVVAGVLKDTALDVSPDLKVQGFPWHLFLMATFFILLKLPGPYYPYWGRIFIPHFANGGLWRTLWFAFSWYRRSEEGSNQD